jgi:hypothetical protein
MKIVENANTVDPVRLDKNLTDYLKRALKPLPQASQQ